MKTNTNAREQELDQQIIALRNEQSELRIKRRIRENKKSVGKCFKIRNQYGDGKQWWLYKKVVGFDDCGWLKTIEFQETSTGSFEFRSDETIGDMHRYIPITERKFQDAYNAFVARMHRKANQ